MFGAPVFFLQLLSSLYFFSFCKSLAFLSRPGNGVGRRWFCSILSIYLSIHYGVCPSVRPVPILSCLIFAGGAARSLRCCWSLRCFCLFSCRPCFSVWLSVRKKEGGGDQVASTPGMNDTLELAAGVRVFVRRFIVCRRCFCNGPFCAGGARTLSLSLSLSASLCHYICTSVHLI